MRLGAVFIYSGWRKGEKDEGWEGDCGGRERVVKCRMCLY